MKMWLFSIRKDIAGQLSVQQKCDVLSEEIARLESIIHNFLEFSQPPGLKLRVQSVSHLVGKALELIHHRLAERRITLEQSGLEGLPPVLVDSDQLKQVFLNLLLNALEAAGSGGQIWISAASGPDDMNREMVVVRIKDSGPGMTDDVASRIFEPFFTTKDEGTGLGLCIAANIMMRHGGRLLLENSSHVGASFAMWIPTVAEESP